MSETDNLYKPNQKQSIMKNVTINWNQTRNYAVMVGAAVIGANAIVSMTKSGFTKASIWPAVTLLVGIAAFTAAQQANKVTTA